MVVVYGGMARGRVVGVVAWVQGTLGSATLRVMG